MFIERSEYRHCWSISRSQLVYPKEKFSVHSRPEPSCVTWVQTQTGTEAEPRRAGSRHLQGRYQAPTTAPQPSVQSKQQDLGFGGQDSGKHSPGSTRVLQGLWHPECEQGPKMGSPRVGEIWPEVAMGHLSWTTHLPTQAGSLVTAHAQWLFPAASLSHCSASDMNLCLVRSQDGVSSL